MIIKVKIQPNSKENKIVETLEDGSLKIKIKAPQIEGWLLLLWAASRKQMETLGLF